MIISGIVCFLRGYRGAAYTERLGTEADMRGMRIGTRITACLLAFVLAAGMLAGCGGKEGAETGGSGDGMTDSTSGGEARAGEEQGIAMGRYVEKEVDLGGNSLTDWNGRIFRMADGSLLLSDNSGFVLRSRDNGASWSKEDLPWLTKMKEENKYIYTMAFGSDQTAAVIWTEPEEGTEDSGDGVQLKMDFQITLVKSDNTEIPVDVKLEAEDMMPNSVSFTEEGRIIVATAGSNLYEVSMDGSMEKFLYVDEGSPSLLRFHGDIMIMDGWGWDTPLLYDMAEKTYIEDDVLSDFVEENYADRESNPGDSYDLFVVSGDEESIYLAGQSGVYRHVLGGSVMEQVMDGSLNILGSPTCKVMDMLVADNNEFVMLFTGEKMARFVYDPNVPSRPNEKMTVWSLEDEAVIRQAISQYQKENPAVYVEYEIGLAGNSMTREDAIKNLNTRTMAGKGPDVFVLDNMPVSSYIEKGILMDLAPTLDGMSGEEAVFPNVVDAFRKDGKVYSVPCEMQLPYVLGRNSDIREMTGLSDIAGAAEEMRADRPGADLLRLSSAKAVMRVFSMASAPVWRTAEGTLDKETLADFLTQTKRIYDAQMDGLSEEALEEWKAQKEVYQSYESVSGEELEDADEIRTRHQGVYFMGGAQQFAVGSIENITEYNCHTSLPKTEGFENCGSMPMTGQCGNVFWARTLLGINASSANADRAQAFLKTVLGRAVQTELTDGIPVTQKAILDNYADQWNLYRDNDFVSGQGSTNDADGNEVVLLIRVPDEAEVNELIAWIRSLDTAYVEDKTFENVVYEEGMKYIRGDAGLDEVMGSIETRIGLYLAE